MGERTGTTPAGSGPVDGDAAGNETTRDETGGNETVASGPVAGGLARRGPAAVAGSAGGGPPGDGGPPGGDPAGSSRAGSGHGMDGVTGDGPAGHPAAATAVAGAVRPRPGAGPPGRPGLGWTELGFTVVVYLVLSVVAVLVTGMPGPQGQNTIPVLLGAAAAALLTAAGALALRVRWLPALGLRSTTWRWLLAGVGVGVLARVLAFGLVLAYVAVTGDHSDPQDFLLGTAAAGGVGLLLLILCGAVVTPVAEELMFRGVVFGALRRYGPAIAVVVSALVFGLAHGLNVVLPVAVVLGALNALLYERSGSIWPGVVAHGVHNALGFLLAALVLG